MTSRQKSRNQMIADIKREECESTARAALAFASTGVAERQRNMESRAAIGGGYHSTEQSLVQRMSEVDIHAAGQEKERPSEEERGHSVAAAEEEEGDDDEGMVDALVVKEEPSRNFNKRVIVDKGTAAVANKKTTKITDFFGFGKFDPMRFMTETPPKRVVPVKQEEPEIVVKLIADEDGDAGSSNLNKSNGSKKRKKSSAPKNKTAPKKRARAKKSKTAVTVPVTKEKPPVIELDKNTDNDDSGNNNDNGDNNDNGNSNNDDDGDDDEVIIVRERPRSPPAEPGKSELTLSQIQDLIGKIQAGTEPDMFNPKYHCLVCPSFYDLQRTFFNHLTIKHKIDLEERRYLYLKYGPKPNITDASIFCDICQKQYDTKDRFQHHNELHHGAPRLKRRNVVGVTRLAKTQEQDSNNSGPSNGEEEGFASEESLTSDEEEEEGEENEAARLMERLSTRSRGQLGRCQQAILDYKGPPPDINDPNFCCCVCKYTFQDRCRYFIHLRVVHKMQIEGIVSKKKKRNRYKGPGPDVNDPNNYCRVCDVRYKMRLTYTYHLRNVHKMDIPFEKSPGKRIAVEDMEEEAPKPDAADPDFYCNYCQRGYRQRTSYLIHLTQMHFMEWKQKRPKAMKPRPVPEPGIIPDVLDPNHYCCVCDVRFAHANSYRIHIKRFHNMGDALDKIFCNGKRKFVRKKEPILRSTGIHDPKIRKKRQR